MQSGDAAVLAAMDGQELQTQNGEAKIKPREDPTAFFYVLFGLVYEALSTSSPDSGSANLDRQTLVIACLDALKALVRPEYAGRAIMEPNIFDEFISLLYRMAMTEPAAVQVHLVEVLGILAASQGSRCVNSLSSAVKCLTCSCRQASILSLTNPRTHCLKICSHILKHSTGPSRGPISREWSTRNPPIPWIFRVGRTEGPPADRISLINSSFATLATIAASTETSQREDIRSLAVLLFNGKLPTIY